MKALRVDTSTVNLVHIHAVNSPKLVRLETLDVYTGKVQTVTSTASHPFYCNETWITADELKEGDQLLMLSNKKLEPMIITKKEVIISNLSTVYNLNTTSHTFFANGFLVHNK